MTKRKFQNLTTATDWHLDADDAAMLREMPNPEWADGPEPPSDDPDEMRRWGMRINMDEIIFGMTEGTQYPKMTLNELLVRKGLTLDTAWELAKECWLKVCGHDPIGTRH